MRAQEVRRRGLWSEEASAQKLEVEPSSAVPSQGGGSCVLAKFLCHIVSPIEGAGILVCFSSTPPALPTSLCGQVSHVLISNLVAYAFIRLSKRLKAACVTFFDALHPPQIVNETETCTGTAFESGM